MVAGTGISFATKITEEPAGGGTPAGNTSEVQYNKDGAFAASADFTFVDDGKTGETLTIGGLGINSNQAVQSVDISGTDQTGVGVYGTSITITGGDSADYTGGFVDIKGGDSKAAAGYGGEVLVVAGAGYSGGSCKIVGGAGDYGGASSIIGGTGTKDGGHINITGGAGTTNGGDVIITPGTGATPGDLLLNDVNVANGTVACVLTATSGPTGAQTAVQGWLRLVVGGTPRFIPFW